ncbi:hypothetical protein ACFLY6_03230 [Candidatus Dependentiae bacterium]
MGKENIAIILSMLLSISCLNQLRCHENKITQKDLKEIIYEEWKKAPEEICDLVAYTASYEEAALQELLNCNLKLVLKRANFAPGTFFLSPRTDFHWYGGSVDWSGKIEMCIDNETYAFIEDGILYSENYERTLSAKELLHIFSIVSLEVPKNKRACWQSLSKRLIKEHLALKTFLEGNMAISTNLPPLYPRDNLFWKFGKSEILIPVHTDVIEYYISLRPSKNGKDVPSEDHMSMLTKQETEQISKMLEGLCGKKFKKLKKVWKKALTAVRGRRKPYVIRKLYCCS